MNRKWLLTRWVWKTMTWMYWSLRLVYMNLSLFCLFSLLFSMRISKKCGRGRGLYTKKVHGASVIWGRKKRILPTQCRVGIQQLLRTCVYLCTMLLAPRFLSSHFFPSHVVVEFSCSATGSVTQSSAPSSVSLLRTAPSNSCRLWQIPSTSYLNQLWSNEYRL